MKLISKSIIFPLVPLFIFFTYDAKAACSANSLSVPVGFMKLDASQGMLVCQAGAGTNGADGWAPVGEDGPPRNPQNSQTFDYGAIQDCNGSNPNKPFNWVVPSGVKKVLVEAWGGGVPAINDDGVIACPDLGMSSPTYGKYVKGFYYVMPGDTVKIRVGAPGKAPGCIGGDSAFGTQVVAGGAGAHEKSISNLPIPDTAIPANQPGGSGKREYNTGGCLIAQPGRVIVRW